MTCQNMTLLYLYDNNKDLKETEKYVAETLYRIKYIVDFEIPEHISNLLFSYFLM